jgi:hypothetical protein
MVSCYHDCGLTSGSSRGKQTRMNLASLATFVAAATTVATVVTACAPPPPPPPPVAPPPVVVQTPPVPPPIEASGPPGFRTDFGEAWRRHPEGRQAGLKKRCAEFFPGDYGPIVSRLLGGRRPSSTSDFLSVLNLCAHFLPIAPESAYDVSGAAFDARLPPTADGLPDRVEELRRMLLLSELYDSCGCQGAGYPLRESRKVLLRRKIVRLKGEL